MAQIVALSKRMKALCRRIAYVRVLLIDGMENEKRTCLSDTAH